MFSEDTEYPPTIAARIADTLRANPDHPALQVRRSPHDARRGTHDAVFQEDRGYPSPGAAPSKSRQAAAKDAVRSYTDGQDVEYWSDSRQAWVPAKIAAVQADGTVHVATADGRVKHIRSLQQVRLPSKATRYEIGQEVEYWSESRKIWQPAKISNVRRDGSVYIETLDGKVRHIPYKTNVRLPQATLAMDGQKKPPLDVPAKQPHQQPRTEGPLLPSAERMQRSEPQPPMLPIAGRQAEPTTLIPKAPITDRQEDTDRQPPVLPIAGRQAATQPSPMLPIPGRQADAQPAAMLPVAARQPDAQPAAMLPIAARQADAQPSMLPIPSRQNDQPAPLLPIDGRQANAQPAPMLPITGRQPDAQLPIPGRHANLRDVEPPPPPSVGIPGAEGTGGDSPLPLSMGLQLPLRRHEAEVKKPTKWALDTITTPTNSFTRRPIPVPLSSLSTISQGSFGAVFDSRDIAGTSSSVGSLPKWARPGSGSRLGSALDVPSSVHSQHGRLNSSLSDAGGMLPPDTWNTVGSHISTASFKWAPEAFVQCWHRRLCETYNDYNMINVVGEGRTGAVFIVQNKRTEKFSACKVLNKVDHDMQAIRKEIEMLRRLDHPHVVRLYEAIEDHESVFLLMELCHGGDLFSRIHDERHLSEAHSRIFAHQMISALAYCHDRGIVHRDVKPENFLLDKDDPECLDLKLADFGIASNLRHCENGNRMMSCDGSFISSLYGNNCLESLQSYRAESFRAEKLPSFIAQEDASQVGSLPYMAPEMLVGNWQEILAEVKASNSIFAASDLWSVGIVIYVMLSGMLPYGTDPDMICSGMSPDYSDKVWKEISKEALDLLQKLICSSVKDRLTGKQALMHEWFKDHIISKGICQGSGTCVVEREGERFTLNAGDAPVLAHLLLRCLRRWRQTHKLRRIVIAAIAKRLEGDHETQCLANAAFHVFSDGKSSLKCRDFVEALNIALADPSYQAESAMTPTPSNDSIVKDSSALSFGDQEGQPCRLKSLWNSKESRTGLHVRHRAMKLAKHFPIFKASVDRLTRVNEDSPKMERSPASTAFDGDIDIPSLTELRHLVDSLDGMKNGLVDYTLLMASLIPAEVYGDEVRIREVFDLFDFQKLGRVSPDDVRKVLTTKNADMKDFVAMVNDFDCNKDGYLDFKEFRDMVRGAAVRTGFPDVSNEEHHPRR